MKEYYKCKWCGTVTKDPRLMCFNCREKLKIITNSGVFRGNSKKEKRHKTAPADICYHGLGSETQRLVDFVNKIGTIHYGRYVAKELMK